MAFTTQTTPIGAGIFHAFKRMRDDFARSYARHRAYVETRNALVQLDNTTLADLGIARSQIDSIARETSKTVG